MLKRTAFIARLLLCTLVLTGIALAQTAKRPLKLDDLPHLREVRDPQFSPDGQCGRVCCFRH